MVSMLVLGNIVIVLQVWEGVWMVVLCYLVVSLEIGLEVLGCDVVGMVLDDCSVCCGIGVCFFLWFFFFVMWVCVVFGVFYEVVVLNFVFGCVGGFVCVCLGC